MTQNPTLSRTPIPWGRYLLLFFVAAWMFILGVLVGRGSAPVTFDIAALEKKLVERRQTALREHQEAVEKAVGGKNENAPLAFYDVLKSDTPDLIVEIPQADVLSGAQPLLSGNPSPPHKTRAPIMAKKTPAAVSTESVALPPDRNRSETSPPPIAVIPSAPLPPPKQPVPPSVAADAGSFTIQIAATKDADAAERIVANLQKEGYSAYLSRVVVPGKGLWFRIRVGSYQTRAQAASDMARLVQAKKSPILVPK